MTTVDRASLSAAFADALASYLNDPDETALSLAYELGRRAIDEGWGLLAVVLMYQTAVSTMPDATGGPLRMTHAAEFLVEALAPFEMTYRGYKDANEQLTTLTRILEERNCDLTDATSAAEAANKELEAFSYSVSHDLRAPVRHIAGFAQVLLDEHAKDLLPAAVRHVVTIQRAAQNMGQMIDDLLNLSRIERQELVRRPVDLSALVAEAIRELGADLSGREIDWRVDTLGTTMCDPGLMKLVFTNLLSNAAKYTSHRARAVIHVGRTGDDSSMVMFVKDNGAGFDPAYAHKLFGAFQRLHRSEEFEGTGIGLATVARIVRKHGGRVWAEGTPDAGATFFLTLGS